MSQPVVVPRHPKSCAGCAGSGACWVCLGTGQVNREDDHLPCHRCGGNGLCHEPHDSVAVVPLAQVGL